MTISLVRAQRRTVFDRQKGALPNVVTTRQGILSRHSHVVVLPRYHDDFVITLHPDTIIALNVSLEDATIRMIDDCIVIDFARIRGGRIILDLAEAGPDVIFAAQIAPNGGAPMPAFEAFFHALSTELDFPVSDVAWALALAVRLEADNYLPAAANTCRCLAAE